MIQVSYINHQNDLDSRFRHVLSSNSSLWITQKVLVEAGSLLPSGSGRMSHPSHLQLEDNRFINDSSILRIAICMSRRLKDFSLKDIEKLPTIAEDHFCIGEEWIYIHLWNHKKMNWYLAEYGSINKRFFGFFENKNDGIASGFCTLDEILSLGKRGEAWEVLVDEDWKPTVAKEIPSLKGYINMMRCPPDNM